MKNLNDLEDEKALEVLQDNSRSMTTGTDDDLAVDIQDAIGRVSFLSMVADNIHIIVENQIVTLMGEVFTAQEKRAIGDIATAIGGDDNVNNYLRVILQ